MEQLRIDKVTRIINWLGFKKVYSLILKGNTLYVIRTGNVGALMGMAGVSGIANQAIASAYNKKFVKELEEGEKRLDRESLDQLANEKKNEKIHFSEITNVEVDYGKIPSMKINTANKKLKFQFTHTKQEKIKELEKALKKQ